MNLRTPFLALVALALLLVAASGTAAAHKTAYSDDGKVRIVWGFLGEPTVTWTKTGLDLQLRDNETGAPLEGAEKTLSASLVLGSQVHPFSGLAAQHGAENRGRYTDVITLTTPGLYSLRLQGTVNGTAIDMTIPAQHEVSDVKATYFPDAASPSEMQARLKALEDQVAALKATQQTQAETPATLTPQDSNGVPAASLVALLGVVGVALLLLRRRA